MLWGVGLCQLLEQRDEKPRISICTNSCKLHSYERMIYMGCRLISYKLL